MNQFRTIKLLLILPNISKQNIFFKNPLNRKYSTTAPCQLGRHLYHEECENEVNNQIGAEMQASYAYLEIASHFGNTEIALPGCYAFFRQMHFEELGHAHKLIRYQNLRGGKVTLSPLKPTLNTGDSLNIEKSLALGLQTEKEVKEKLINVHNVAEKQHDLNLMDFIVTEFIMEQERSIQEYARLLNRYKSMMGCGTCSCVDFLFDKEMHKIFSQKNLFENLKFTDEEQAFK